MTVYADEVLFLNTVLDFLLLATASLLSDRTRTFGRMALAALLGGVYAMLAAIVPVLKLLPFQLLAAVLICLCAYGTGKAALRRSALFGLVCCGYGGMTMLAAILCKTQISIADGMPYFALRKQFLILLAALLYAAVWLTMRRLCRHFGTLLTVAFVLGDCRAETTALCDTGNTLKDCVTGESVIIADLTTARQLFPQAGITAADLQQPAALLQRILLHCPASKPRLLPFHTVSGGGLLLAVRCTQIEINGKKTAQHIVAFSPSAFSEEEPYHALTGGIYDLEKPNNPAASFGGTPQGIRALHRRQRHSAAAADTVRGAAGAAAHGVGR